MCLRVWRTYSLAVRRDLRSFFSVLFLMADGTPFHLLTPAALAALNAKAAAEKKTPQAGKTTLPTASSTPANGKRRESPLRVSNGERKSQASPERRRDEVSASRPAPGSNLDAMLRKAQLDFEAGRTAEPLTATHEQGGKNIGQPQNDSMAAAAAGPATGQSNEQGAAILSLLRGGAAPSVQTNPQGAAILGLLQKAEAPSTPPRGVVASAPTSLDFARSRSVQPTAGDLASSLPHASASQPVTAPHHERFAGNANASAPHPSAMPIPEFLKETNPELADLWHQRQVERERPRPNPGAKSAPAKVRPRGDGGTGRGGQQRNNNGAKPKGRAKRAISQSSVKRNATPSTGVPDPPSTGRPLKQIGCG